MLPLKFGMNAINFSMIVSMNKKCTQLWKCVERSGIIESIHIVQGFQSSARGRHVPSENFLGALSKFLVSRFRRGARSAN